MHFNIDGIREQLVKCKHRLSLAHLKITIHALAKGQS